MTQDGPRVRLRRRVLDPRSVRYELDLAGMPMTIRMSPTETDTGQVSWLVEATSTRAAESTISAAAPTREAALEEVGRAWVRQAGPRALPSVDWSNVQRFLKSVRAV